MLLETLILGALMGMLGQGARAVAGLKSMSDDAKALDLSPNDLFEAGRLITSFLIGSLVGLASALVYVINSAAPLQEPNWHLLLAWAAAAYAGTDFLESFISQYLAPGAAPLKVERLAALKVVIPTPLSIVQRAFKIAFGLQAVTSGQDLSKDLHLSGFDYIALQGQINAQLVDISGAQLIGSDTMNGWQAQGKTVGDVVKDVAAALPH